MCKKLFYLISFVLVLGLFTPVASAFDYFWFEAEEPDTMTGGPRYQIFNLANPGPPGYVDMASGKGYIGVLDGGGDHNGDPPPADDGWASYNFNAEGGDYIVLCRTYEGGSDSFWITILDADIRYPGWNANDDLWIRWNSIQGGAPWNWDDVHDDQRNNPRCAVFGLAHGPQTLVVGRREDGTFMDVILVTNDLSILNDHDPRSDRQIHVFPKLVPWGEVPFDGQAVDPTEFTELTWMGGYNAATYDVYFGTEESPPLVASDKAEPNYVPAPLAFDTTYYWKIVDIEADPNFTHTGTIWSFRTVRYAGMGKIYAEWYTGFEGTYIGGGDISDLLGWAGFPDDPDFTGYLPYLEGPRNFTHDYGTRISGWLVPKTGGSYTFWIASDDGAELWLGTGPTPDTASMICYEGGSRGDRNWAGGSGDQETSNPISLQGGQRYYIEILHKEGGGGDNIAVAWEGPDQPVARVNGQLFPIIDGYFLEPYQDLYAYGLSPENGSKCMPISTILSWTAAGGAAWHEVWFGEDPLNMNLVATKLLAETTYDPVLTAADYGKTFYWQIVEVNPLGPDPCEWPGGILSFSVVPDPLIIPDCGLFGHWKFDGDAMDSSGYGNHGTAVGGPTYASGPFGQAIDLDGINDLVSVDHGTIVTDVYSMAFWHYPHNLPHTEPYRALMHTSVWSAGALHLHLRANSSVVNFDWNGGPNSGNTSALVSDEWCHIAFSVDRTVSPAESKIYINGVLENSNTGGASALILGAFNIGAYQGNSRWVDGLFDDFRLYNRALSLADVEELATPPWATKPIPANGATDVSIETELCWSAGKDAATHKVYIGTDPTALSQIDTLALETECHDPVDPALPADPNLVAGTTYYWRIDEVGAYGTATGIVWSFTTVSGKAGLKAPPDGEAAPCGEFEYLGDLYITRSLTVIPGATSDELERVGYFSDDFNDVNDRLLSAKLGGPPFVDPPNPDDYFPNMFFVGIPGELYGFKGVPVPGTGTDSLIRLKTYYWCCDETDYKGNTFPGDVWSFTVMGVKVFGPDPEDGELYVDPNVLLTWQKGQPMGTKLEFDIYLSTDYDEVANAVHGDPSHLDTVEELAEYQCENLPLDTTFYWRIDTVWGRDPPWQIGTIYTGDVWSFTTLPAEILLPITMDLFRDASINGNMPTLYAYPGFHPIYPDNPTETHLIPNFDSEAYNNNLGDNYGGRIQGYLHIKESGEYQFAIASDDDSELWLNTTGETSWDATLIAFHDGSVGTYNWNWGGTPTRKSAPIYLEGGKKYYIKGLWAEGGGGDHCMVAYYGPDQPVTPVNGNGVWVIPGSGSGALSKLSPYEYVWASWPTPVVEANDVPSPVTFTWGPGAHAVRHDFYLGTDMADVENADTTTPIIYKGPVGPNTYGPIPIPLDAPILFWRIDEVNLAGPDPCVWKGQVWHFRPPGAAGGLLAMLYHTGGGGPPADPFQTFVQAQIEPIVSFWRADHYWSGSGGSPDPNVNVNNFACRFVGHVEILKAGEYTFETRCDDGSRLFIDGIELRLRRDGDVTDPESSWSQGGMRNYSAPVYLTAGLHDIEMQMYEASGGAGAELRWWGPGRSREIIPSYYLWPPLFATNPRPKDGAIVETRKPALEWRPGIYATSHELYFSANFDDVNDRNPLALEYSGPDPCYPYPALGDPLELGGTYYWLVDEVKSGTRWEARTVWSFTLSECLYIDGFEDYNDRRQLREHWTDGYSTVDWDVPVGYPGLGGSSGSYLSASTGVGSPTQNATGPVLTGEQAMALYYDGDDDSDGVIYVPGSEEWFYETNVNYSEIEATTTSLDLVQNWADEGVKALSLSYQGHPQSDGGFDDSGWPVFIAKGRGRNINGRWDEFYFFNWYPFNVEGYVEVKVESMDNTHPRALAGVMMREKMTPSSKYAAVFITPGQGVTFQYRSLENGPTVTTTKAGVTAPQYVRLERYATNDFKAFHSSDGFTWEDANGPGTNQDSWENILMDADLYAGVAVTSHNATVTCTANFNNIKIADLFGSTAVWPASWFEDDIGTNDAEQMYVAISDGTTTAVVENPDPNATVQTTWQKWYIDMREFTNVNFNNVEKIIIGIGDKGDPLYEGGSGTLYIDDIQTCPPTCIPDDSMTSPPLVNPRPVGDIATPFDCFVDGLDAAVMAGDWLLPDELITTTEVLPSDPNLILYYDFEGDTIDSGPYGFHGDPCGNPTYVVGAVGQAIDLDGTDDYVRTDMNAIELGIDGNTPRSVSVWVFTRAFNNGGIWDAGARTNGQDFSLRTLTGTNQWRVQYWGGAADHDFTYDSLNKWVHFALVYNGSLSSVYADGRLVSSRAAVTLDTSSANPFQVGCYGWQASYFNGIIDEFRLYNRALSKEEVAYFASKGAPTLHIPISSLAELHISELPGQQYINFRDYSKLADTWLTEKLWPDIP